MIKPGTTLDIPMMNGDTISAMTLGGTLKNHSTEELHRHSYHQVLVIRNGVSMLVEEKRKQPLYGSMCAFIPAGVTHRTIVIGESIRYQSLYFKKELLSDELSEISIFNIGELSTALFDRLNEKNFEDLSPGIMGECLSLFLKTLKEDMDITLPLVRIPEASKEENRMIIKFIEENFREKLHLAHFRSVLPYSHRHIARIFKEDLKITVFEYLRLYRMFRASVMLHEKARSVTGIAYDCGYESLSSFYADFNKYYSLTPKEFREKI
ncbi:MAG: AraC family transcriptional regulator [bacterium]|nr:AraC family transcriptional regulator [bacterium]